jgi:hypothetical protein
MALRQGLCGVFALLVLGSAAAAAPPRQFRGDGTGRAPGARPPLKWSPTSNVAWSAPLPSWSNASPVVVGGRVCACSEPTTLLCVDAATGRLLWAHEVTLADTLPTAARAAMRAQVKADDALEAGLAPQLEELARLRRGIRKGTEAAGGRARAEALSRAVNGARRRLDANAAYRPPPDLPTIGNSSATPVTDGKNLYALFGNYVVASLDAAGAVRWARAVARPSGAIEGRPLGQAASPVLAGGLLIVPLGVLSGLDPATGEVVWAQDEYPYFGTPTVARHGGEELLFLPGGAILRARDGRKVAEADRSVSYVGPTIWKDRYLFAGGGHDADDGVREMGRIFAFAFPPAPGAGWPPRFLWQATLEREHYYTAPVVHDGRLFAVDKVGGLVVVDLAAGEIIHRRKLGHDAVAYPSPIVAGDHLFVSTEDGVTSVLEARPPFREVARNTLEPFRSTPAVDGRRLYVRGMTRLWALEAGPGPR